MKENYDHKTQERILAVLSEEPFAHITEIAKEAKTMRITAKKHLERLKREGIVEERRKGRCRLFMLKGEI